jgi:hypothetical protein
MPAKSKSQQRFMGMVNAVKKGEMKAPSKEVAKTAKGMTKKAAHDFAATKHKGLPDKVKEAANPAQQAAIAVNMKKDGKKPKKTEEAVHEEKWIKVHKSREGMFKGKGKAELEAMKSALKKRNAAKKEKGESISEKDKTKMAQLNFALRAKKDHGIHESQHSIEEMINDYHSLNSIKQLDEEDIRTINLINEEIAYTLEANMVLPAKTLNESWTHDSLARHLFEHDDMQEPEPNGDMAKQQLFELAQGAIQLYKMLESGDQIEPWLAYKISLAYDYIDTVKDYLEYQAAKKMDEPEEIEVSSDDVYMENLTDRLYKQVRNS